MDAISLEILYKGNIAICQKAGIGRKECETQIEGIIQRIQGVVQETCKDNTDCQKRGFRFHIHTEELQRIKDRMLQTYT